jgi:hypothetical protein
MHPDLMRAPSPRNRSDNAEAVVGHAAIESALDGEFSACRNTGRMNRLLEPDWRWRVNSLSGERRIHRFRIPFRPAPDNCEIFFSDALLLHHYAKTSRRGRGLRHQHQSARFPVEPIDYRNLPTIRNLEGEQMFQFAPECPRPSRSGGMNKQEWWLLDNNEIIALPDYREVLHVICATCVSGG